MIKTFVENLVPGETLFQNWRTDRQKDRKTER